MRSDRQRNVRGRDSEVLASRRRLFVLALLLVVTAWTLNDGPAMASERLDPNFGVGGVAVVPSDDASSAVDVTEDSVGRLFLVGNRGFDSGPGTSCQGYRVARVLGTGEPDLGFGNSGISAGPPRCDAYFDIESFKNDDPLITGSKRLFSGPALGACAIATRLKASGAPAAYWGAGVWGFTAVCNGQPGRGASGLVASGAKIDASKRTLIVGQAWHGQTKKTGFLLRLNSGGKRDRGFKGDRRTASRLPGMVEIQSANREEVSFEEVLPLASGKILVGGTFGGSFLAARFRGNGSLDGSFGHRGMTVLDLDGTMCACSQVEAMDTDRRGRIVLIGSTFKVKGATRTKHGYRPALVRLKRNGTRDLAFGFRGVSKPGWSKFYTRSAAVQNNGKIVVLGTQKGQSVLARVLPTGKPDLSFFHRGMLRDFSPIVGSAIIDHRGRIVVSGGTGHGDFQLTRIIPE